MRITGSHIYAKDKICSIGTIPDHLSVKTTLTKGSANTAKPIIKGKTT